MNDDDGNSVHLSSSSSTLPQTRILRVQRTWIPPNNLKHNNTHVEMTVTIQRNKSELTVIDTRIFENTLSSPWQAGNLWHRIVPQYSSWVALQTAQRKFNLTTDQVVYYFNCKNRRLDDVPNEWEKIGIVSCNQTLLEVADVVIVPPLDGFLWDLAWDMDLACYNSQMFQSFASLFVDRTSPVKPPAESRGCFLSREGRPSRTVVNWNETLAVMNQVFDRTKVLTLTQYHTTDETATILEGCQVLFGVHGAGHMNALFARPGVAVVEMVGNATPAYFRNINMLLGQYYEGISGDSTQDLNGKFWVNITQAREALTRAKEHTEFWIQYHGHWR